MIKIKVDHNVDWILNMYKVKFDLLGDEIRVSYGCAPGALWWIREFIEEHKVAIEAALKLAIKMDYFKRDKYSDALHLVF